MALSREHKDHLLAGIIIVLGLVIILTPWYIFPVCEIAEKQGSSQDMQNMQGMNMNSDSNSHMRCWYTAEAETGAGAFTIVLGILLFALKDRKVRRALGGITLIAGVIVALIPTVLVGTCASPDSPCNIGTKPALILLGALTVIASLYLVLARDENPGTAP